jgi:hypothetical protein
VTVNDVAVTADTPIRYDAAGAVKDGPHLTLRFSHAGFEPCALEVHFPILKLNLGADVVDGVMWFHRIQTIRISDASAHPFQFLSVRVVR